MEDGVWRTVRGRRIFIKEGQSLSDAMKDSWKFENKKLNNQTKDKTEFISSERWNNLNDGTSEKNKKLVTDTVNEVLEEYENIYKLTGDTFDGKQFVFDTNTVALGSTDYSGNKININANYLKGDNEFFNKTLTNSIDSGYNLSKYGDIRDTVVHEMGHNVLNKIYRHTEIKGKYGDIKYPSTDGADSWNTNFRNEVEREYKTKVLVLKRGQYISDKYSRGTTEYEETMKKMYPSEYAKKSPSECNAEQFLNYYHKKKNNVKLNDFETVWEKVFLNKIKEAKDVNWD